MNIKAKAIELNKTFFPVRDCSICGYMLGYVVMNRDFSNLGFDTGCDCVTYSNINQSSWEEMERFYNSQSDESKAELNKLWFDKI